MYTTTQCQITYKQLGTTHIQNFFTKENTQSRKCDHAGQSNHNYDWKKNEEKKRKSKKKLYIFVLRQWAVDPYVGQFHYPTQQRIAQKRYRELAIESNVVVIYLKMEMCELQKLPNCRNPFENEFISSVTFGSRHYRLFYDNYFLMSGSNLLKIIADKLHTVSSSNSPSSPQQLMHHIVGVVKYLNTIKACKNHAVKF